MLLKTKSSFFCLALFCFCIFFCFVFLGGGVEISRLLCDEVPIYSGLGSSEVTLYQ